MAAAATMADHLPLERMRVFEAAGRMGSFTAAANEVGLTQAAASQRIQNLQARLGARLFTRLARDVRLTVEDRAWLPQVHKALRGLDRSADALFGKPLQKLVLSASASVIPLWVVARLAALEPDAQFQLSLTTVNSEPDFAKSHATVEIRDGNGTVPGVLPLLVERLDRPLDLDQQRVSLAVERLAGRYLDPAFADAVLTDIETLLAVETDTDLVFEYRGNMVRTARVDRQMVGQGRAGGIGCIGHGRRFSLTDGLDGTCSPGYGNLWPGMTLHRSKEDWTCMHGNCGWCR